DLRPGLGGQLNGLAIQKPRLAENRFHVRSLEKPRNAIVQPADDTVLPLHGSGEIELGGRNRYPQGRGLTRIQYRLLEFLCRMDDRLGRDAAYIQACATEAPFLDDHGVDAKLAGADRATVPARAGANDQQGAGN